MSVAELENYAKNGELPQWFKAVGATASESREGDDEG